MPLTYEYLKMPGLLQTTGEKPIDLNEFWKRRGAKSTASLTSPTANTSFKRWKKSHSADNNATTRSKNEDDMNLLKFFALNALDLTAPASDVLLKNRQNKWFQLSGHQDCFAPAGPGTIWKKRSGSDNSEREAYEALTADPILRDLVPRYFREVEYHGEKFIELQDLLHGFSDPSVMDVKMGTRTFLESEVQKTTARQDLYQKMIAVDPNAPSEEEHLAKAVTKLRYMQFREQQSSTCSQGFRIEAMKLRGRPAVTDLKKVKSREEVLVTLTLFLAGREDTRQRFLTRLYEIREKLDKSDYFQRHEVVGSSLFMIYDDVNVGVWLIDFAKTYPVPPGMIVDHRRPWVQGNHEEGLLYGLDHLISVFEEIDFSSSMELDHNHQSKASHSDSNS
ncbi:UNVERIFIED_CONTAM: hypothetical protein PYX00_005186 [Menopon gallinae]|uniref:Kinase n=1 Tax=Menopon gallinae TaxID=328185 RepID=A0AAW2HRK2_9NEOP